MKAIIFGINGQDGHYLKKVLENNFIEVIGVSRSEGEYLKGNISDYDFVSKIIKLYQPAYVFHFAANSSTSHEALFENHSSISTGTLNILESVYLYSRETKIFLSGSGLQFHNKGLPIYEEDPFEASSTYCISRIQSVYAARYYRSLGLRVYVGYFFNHDSPLRSERHINQKIVSSVCKIARGSEEKIAIGNILVRKEFNYALDIVNAVWTLVNNEEIFECVIGSGNAYSIKDWLEICFGYFNLKFENHIIHKEGFKAQYNTLVSNPKTIMSLGWKPQTTISQLAEIMIISENDK